MQDLIPKQKPRAKLRKRSDVYWHIGLNWRCPESAIHITDDGLKTLCGRKIPNRRIISDFNGVRKYHCKNCMKEVSIK